MNESNTSSNSKSNFLKMKRLSSINSQNDKENEGSNNSSFNSPIVLPSKRPQFFKSFSASSAISAKSAKSSKKGESPLKKDIDTGSSSVISTANNPNVYNNLQFKANSVFNTSLDKCLELASAEVVLQSDNVSFGKIPLIIAKCGSILKKHALSEPGIFRIAGNTKKIKILQQIFSTPPKYGQDWKFEDDILPNGFRQFSVHDVSGILRRFLNNMSEPLIPLTCYDKFRKCLKENEVLMRQLMNKNNSGGKIYFTKEEEIVLKVEYLKLKKLSVEDFNENLQENKRMKDHFANQRTLIKQIRICLKKFETYIREDLKDSNKQTLMYLLDLLFLFSQHSDKNLMDAKNLAAIFQPSIISHPDHDMNPKEYELSRIVLEFLINFSYKLLPNVFNIPKEIFQKQIPEDTAGQFGFIKPLNSINQSLKSTTGLSRRHSKSLSITMNDRDNMELLRVVNKSDDEDAESDDNGKFDFEDEREEVANGSALSDEDFGNDTTLDDTKYDTGNITVPMHDMPSE